MTTAAVTGIKKGAADLNTIFEGRTTTAVANTGIKSGATDLAQIFESIASGSAAAATGIKKGASDLNTLFAALGSVSSLSASPVGGTISRERSLPCYARVRFSATGTEYWSPLAGTNAYTLDVGAWMDSGSNTDYWVERVINSGLLQTDAGSGRLALTVDRDFGCVDSTSDGVAVTANVTFNFYDAASGGNLVGSATYSFSASRGQPL